MAYTTFATRPNYGRGKPQPWLWQNPGAGAGRQTRSTAWPLKCFDVSLCMNKDNALSEPSPASFRSHCIVSANSKPHAGPSASVCFVPRLFEPLPIVGLLRGQRATVACHAVEHFHPVLHVSSGAAPHVAVAQGLGGEAWSQAKSARAFFTCSRRPRAVFTCSRRAATSAFKAALFRTRLV